MKPIAFQPGGYAFLPGVFQYSAGVAALPGFELRRVTFRNPPPLRDGCRRVEEIITAAGRPMTSFCACELRSPGQFSEAAFTAFNKAYVEILDGWDLIADGTNPVARSNVCPEYSPPAEPAIYAFSYAVPADAATVPTFIIAGSGEVPEGETNYRDHIVSPGDFSPAGMRSKVRFVRREMERRLAGFGLAWRDVTASQAYSIRDFHDCLADELIAAGAANHGLIWHYCRPPIIGLDFEMDCRGVLRELVV
ncbi:MAG: hypothetical protein JNM20_04765 [Rhizobiales bacterium]|nr:hypothetical protein [Hyphomicrobiales bacterium]